MGDTYQECWLPNDVWWLILSFIPGEERLLKIPCVSRTWAFLLRDKTEVLDLNVCYAYRNHNGPYLSDALVGRVPNIKTFSLNYPDKVTFRGLLALSMLTKLDIFAMRTLEPDALLHLTALVELSIRDGGYHLPLAPHLRSLSMSGNRLVTGRDIERLTALRVLELRCYCSITATELAHFTALERLLVNIPDLCDSTLKHLTNLTKLEILGMTNAFTDNALSSLTNLKTLTLSDVGPSFTGSCLVHLPALTSLGAWDVDLCGFVVLSQLTTLEKLFWRDCRLSELVGLTRLRRLHVGNYFPTTKELFTTLPNLRYLWHSQLFLDPPVTPVTPHDLSRLTKLGANMSSYEPAEFCKEGFSLEDAFLY